MVFGFRPSVISPWPLSALELKLLGYTWDLELIIVVIIETQLQLHLSMLCFIFMVAVAFVIKFKQYFIEIFYIHTIYIVSGYRI